MLRPKTSHSTSSLSASASPSWRQDALSPINTANNDFNFNIGGIGATGEPVPPLNRRAHSASSRLASTTASFPNTAAASSSSSVFASSAPLIESPLTSFSRPQSSMSGRNVKLRPQIGSSHIDAEALIQTSTYHGVPISKRFIPNDRVNQSLQPVMLPKSGKSRDVFIRSGDSVVMFDEEAVRFSSFVNSVEVALAQLPPPGRFVLKDRVVVACNILERLCVFQTPAQRLFKLIKADIYRGIWHDYQPAAPNVPENFDRRRAYFEDCLGVAGSVQVLTEQTNEALEQVAALRTACQQKDKHIEVLEAAIFATKEENLGFKEKEGGFQEIFARSLVRMRSDQAKRIEVEKHLRDMQLKVMMFVQKMF